MLPVLSLHVTSFIASSTPPPPGQSLDRLGSWMDIRDDSAEISFQSFLLEATVSNPWHGQGSPLFDVVHPAFLLPTTASSALQGALKNYFGEAVVACDMPSSLLPSPPPFPGGGGGGSPNTLTMSYRTFCPCVQNLKLTGDGQGYPGLCCYVGG